MGEQHLVSGGAARGLAGAEADRVLGGAEVVDVRAVVDGDRDQVVAGEGKGGIAHELGDLQRTVVPAATVFDGTENDGALIATSVPSAWTRS